MTADAGAGVIAPSARTALRALALASFGIGMGEFVIVGLLPDVSSNLHVEVPRAGLLVSAYALSVAFGSPFVAAALYRLPARDALVTLMVVFLGGSVACALAPGFALLLAARVITALAHGAFFGIGAVVAMRIVPPGKGARAVALLFTGLTFANVVGVPAGSWIGQSFGWRASFFIVAAIGVLSLVAIARWVPRDHAAPPKHLRGELAALWSGPVWFALFTSATSSSALFVLLTFLTPFLERETGLSPHGASLALLVFGLGMTAGGLVGGRVPDRRLLFAIRSFLVLDAAVLCAMAFLSGATWTVMPGIFVWGAIAFGLVPPLQTLVVAKAREAPHLASTLNQSAFNLGDAAGAAIGSQWLTHSYTYASLPLLAAAVATLALLPACAIWSKSAARIRSREVQTRSPGSWERTTRQQDAS